MRPLSLLALGMLLLCSGAGASEWLTADHPSYPVEPIPRSPVTIYQNVDITTIGDTQVACGVSGSYTTQNWFLRRFFLNEDHGLTTLRIDSVDFAVGFLTGEMTVDIMLCSIPHGAAFLFVNLTEMERVAVTIDPADQGQFLNVPFNNSCITDGEATDLVVAINAPSGEANLVSFYPGANDAGAYQDAYIAAEACGITDPIGVSEIGFPDSQTLFIVNGDDDACGIPPPDDPEACCFEDGSCQYLYADSCLQYGGDPQGYGTGCSPNLCPTPVATAHTTWGAVKQLFR